MSIFRIALPHEAAGACDGGATGAGRGARVPSTALGRLALITALDKRPSWRASEASSGGGVVHSYPRMHHASQSDG